MSDTAAAPEADPAVEGVDVQPNEASEQPGPTSMPADGPVPQSEEANLIPLEVSDHPEAADDGTSMMNGFSAMNGDASFLATQMDGTGEVMMPMVPQMQPISSDEIALYDRQIRLWGVQAQEKIRSANILLIGIKGLGNEIAKNLVLAGVGVLTILDHELVTEDDLGAQFLVTEDQVGQSRAAVAKAELQKMNPRVDVYADTDLIFGKMPEYFSTFDITIATGLPLDALTSINVSCRNYSRKFYAADTHGMYGYIFADLFIHQFVIEKDKSTKPTRPGEAETPMRAILSVTEKKENNKTIEIVTKQEQYSPLLLVNSSPLPLEITRSIPRKKKVTPLLACFRALLEFQRSNPEGRFPNPADKTDLMMFAQLCNQKQLELDLPREALKAEFLRSFLANIGAELSPVVAFLGGHLAQDVINVLGQREQPLQNYLLFDGETMSSSTYSIHPSMEALGMQLDNGMEMAAGYETSNGQTEVPVMNGTAAAA